MNRWVAPERLVQVPQWLPRDDQVRSARCRVPGATPAAGVAAREHRAAPVRPRPHGLARAGQGREPDVPRRLRLRTQERGQARRPSLRARRRYEQARRCLFRFVQPAITNVLARRLQQRPGAGVSICQPWRPCGHVATSPQPAVPDDASANGRAVPMRDRAHHISSRTPAVTVWVSSKRLATSAEKLRNGEMPSGSTKTTPAPTLK